MQLLLYYWFVLYPWSSYYAWPCSAVNNSSHLCISIQHVAADCKLIQDEFNMDLFLRSIQITPFLNKNRFSWIQNYGFCIETIASLDRCVCSNSISACKIY
eukprot:434616_1